MDEKTKPGEDRRKADLGVPEKQLHRWKDDGGAIGTPPEPEPRPDDR